jgi:hypothetical protein
MPTVMVISPPVLEHVRTALLGATGVAIEDVGTLAADLHSEADRPSHPDQAGKCVAYHELMAALRVRYVVQEIVGLPGEPLAEIELGGPGQTVVIEALTDYRDATLALLGEGRLAVGVAKRAANRVELISSFLAGEQITESRERDVA